PDEDLNRLRKQELDPDLGDEAPPAAVDHIHRLFAEDLVAGHRVHEHGGLLAIRGLTWRRRSVILSSVEQQFQVDGSRAPAHGTTAVDRGADLLVRVLESEELVALIDLASAAGLPKSTASRLVSALERRGLIEQN